MGADVFDVLQEGSSAEDAFRQAVDQALWEYGHGGYTGTIAEKDGFLPFTLPENVTVDEVVDAMLVQGGDELLEGWYGKSGAGQIRTCFNDKWGPAVAFKVGENKWHFCGWASC